MTKKLLVLTMTFVSCVMTFATDMIVKQKNGDALRFDVKNVEEVIFEETIPENLTVVDESETPLKFKILSENTVEVIRDDSYSKLSSVTIPAKVRIDGKVYDVTSIGFRAFSWCIDMTSIEIPNSVTSIGVRAFEGCNGLTSIKIPNSVTSIGSRAFEFCSSLTSISIPEGVTSIGDGAFSECSGLTSIDIPNSVTSIGDGAFSECSGLNPKLLVYDKGTKCYGWIGDLKKCTEVVIPENVTSIGNNAFWLCSGLTSIKIPNSVTSIGDRAFGNCINLDVVIDNSEGNVEVGIDAFQNCKSVTWLKE